MAPPRSRITAARKLVLSLAASAALACPVSFVQGRAVPQTVKLAWIDPLSGRMALVGQNQVRSWQYVADFANRHAWAADVRFEVVAFDSKLNPADALVALRQAVDQGIRYIVQGNGSGVAIALAEAIQKHNERNPGRELVYLNYAAVDPSLTNQACSFWHFRLDINADMKMEALTAYLARDPAVRKVYLINQDYAFGRSVERAAEEYLRRKRADVQVVGKELHPLALVRDFAPHVARIKASGADTIITGDWGADLANLVTAARDAGLQASFYTYYAGTTGVPTAMGASGADRVKIVTNWIVNGPKAGGGEIVDGFKKKYGDDYYSAQPYVGLHLLSEAMRRTGSSDPVKVAFALEGMKLSTINGEVEMRGTDHQLQQNVLIASWVKVDGKRVRYDQEGTGYGWRLDQTLPAYVAAQPTSCQMKRPARP